MKTFLLGMSVRTDDDPLKDKSQKNAVYKRLITNNVGSATLLL